MIGQVGTAASTGTAIGLWRILPREGDKVTGAHRFLMQLSKLTFADAHVIDDDSSHCQGLPDLFMNLDRLAMK